VGSHVPWSERVPLDPRGVCNEDHVELVTAEERAAWGMDRVPAGPPVRTTYMVHGRAVLPTGNEDLASWLMAKALGRAPGGPVYHHVVTDPYVLYEELGTRWYGPRRKRKRRWWRRG